MSSSGIVKDVHSLTSPSRRPPKCYEGWFWRQSWHVACSNHANFRLLTVDLVPYPVTGPVLQEGDAEKLSRALGLERILFLRVS